MKFLLSLVVALLSSCSCTEELMVGGSAGAQVSSVDKRLSAAAAGALAGAPIYRTRHLFFGGDHVITTSSGSNYQHALTASFKDFMQTTGTVASGFMLMKVELAKQITERVIAGEITKRQAAELQAQLLLAQDATQLAKVQEFLKAGAPATIGTLSP